MTSLRGFWGCHRCALVPGSFAKERGDNLDVIVDTPGSVLRSRVELLYELHLPLSRQSLAYVCGPIQQRGLGLLFVQNVGSVTTLRAFLWIQWTPGPDTNNIERLWQDIQSCGCSKRTYFCPVTKTPRRQQCFIRFS
ncbi:hypothetical protein GWK47_004189 [Chionoecetes opilio]|uniref:Uncharacterized protein n=1 Tax=Chionoecetes opilio TaxID=41210 RepID=A0A8J5CZY9_CHIOP|nr:hypothetical protein GWK47_004189 [Chionoecetes opilio]